MREIELGGTLKQGGPRSEASRFVTPKMERVTQRLDVIRTIHDRPVHFWLDDLSATVGPGRNHRQTCGPRFQRSIGERIVNSRQNKYVPRGQRQSHILDFAEKGHTSR